MNPKRLAIWRAFFVLRFKKTKRKLKTTNLHAFTLHNVKKHVFPHPQPQKRVTKLVSALHSYARNRFAIDFARSVHQTGQNGTFPSLETVNGARNFFACREALAGCRGAALTRWRLSECACAVRQMHILSRLFLRNARRGAAVLCRSALRRSALFLDEGEKHISALHPNLKIWMNFDAHRGGICAYVLNVASGSLPLPRPLAHYVRSLGLRRAV